MIANLYLFLPSIISYIKNRELSIGSYKEASGAYTLDRLYDECIANQDDDFTNELCSKIQKKYLTDLTDIVEEIIDGIVNNDEVRSQMLQGYDRVRNLLGGGGASLRTAQEIIKVAKGE